MHTTKALPEKIIPTITRFQKRILVVRIKFLATMLTQMLAVRWPSEVIAFGFFASDLIQNCFIIKVWHYCSQEGLVDSFLCPNGTIYSQERRVCEWYYDVDCTKSNKFIDVNKDLYIIPETTTVSSRGAVEKEELVEDAYKPQLVKTSNLRKRYTPTQLS